MTERDNSGSRARGAFDWFFRNRETGRITIGQFPNVPLWIFLATVVARRIVTEGTGLHDAIEWIAAGSLGWWSVLEIGWGVNPWRRLLGLGGMAFTVAALADLVA